MPLNNNEESLESLVINRRTSIASNNDSGWSKLASVIFSHSHQLTQFNEYVDKKI